MIDSKEREIGLSNGKYILNDLQLEQDMKEMGDRQLLEFCVRLGYSNAIRISGLESRTKKELGATGGIGAIIGVAVATVFESLWRR